MWLFIQPFSGDGIRQKATTPRTQAQLVIDKAQATLVAAPTLEFESNKISSDGEFRPVFDNAPRYFARADVDAIGTLFINQDEMVIFANHASVSARYTRVFVSQNKIIARRATDIDRDGGGHLTSVGLIHHIYPLQLYICHAACPRYLKLVSRNAHS